jgi:uncharacterized protein YegL
MNTNSTIEILSVTSDLKRRDGVGANTKQLVIIIVDASPSMYGEKARQAHAACSELVAELGQPINKNGFIVMVIHFNFRAVIAHPWTSASALAGNIRDLEINNATNMTEAMELALREYSTFNADAAIQYLRPVVLFLTDGCFNLGGHPGAAATALKAKADLVTVAFGNDADEVLLRQMASTPQHFYRVNNGAELRYFMAQVGDTMSISMARKRDSTIPLAMLDRHG